MQEKKHSISLTFISVALLAVILNITKSFMVPFAIAILLAFIIIPIAQSLEEKKVPVFLLNTIVIFGIIVLLTIIGLVFYSSIISVKNKLPIYIDQNMPHIHAVTRIIEEALNIDINNETRQFGLTDVFNYISPSSIVEGINASLGSFMTFLSKVILVILFLMFIFTSRKNLIAKSYEIFPEKNNNGNEMLLQTIARQIQYYLVLKTIISFFTGLLFGLTAFLMGLDFFLVWGFIGFLLNYIPTIGPIIATVPPIIIAVLQFDSLTRMVITILLMSSIQFISGSVIEPKIMGDRLNLNIVAILLSLFLWGLIWGVAGMILAVPLMAALNIALANIPRYKKISMLLSK